MLKSLAALIFLALSAMSFADGPGSRIRTGPPPPQPAGSAAERDTQRCEAMHGDAKERCMRELRAAMRANDRSPPHAGPGPEATGIGSGAGSTAGTGGGTSGGGGTAPR